MSGRDVPDDAPMELILHAYSVWGDECVDHLLGDFSFAIWQRRERRAFLRARPLGIRPFYLAQLGDCLAFSNTLECLRIHPGVSGALNDQFVGDFLLFGMNHEPVNTVYRDIQRLPPAHVLTWSAGKTGQRRYWTLPADGAIRHRRPQEYVEQFSALFGEAIADRTRWNRTGVLMSGGLDSAAVAAVAHKALTGDGGVQPYTMVFDRIMPDRERHFSGLVGQHLGITVQYYAADDYKLSSCWDRSAHPTPEPIDDPMVGLMVEFHSTIAARNRVVLAGYGGDPALCPSRDYFLDLVKRGRLDRFALDMIRYRQAHGRLPPLFLRRRFKQWLKLEKRWEPAYPAWLAPEFERRLRLRDRWQHVFRASDRIHPSRPEAYENLTSDFWPHLFDILNAGTTSLALEVSHPFFDQRLIEFLLAIPPMPYCSDKAILRSAMCGLLPELVRKRPKTPLVADPLVSLLRHCGPEDVFNRDLAPEIGPYVDCNAVAPVNGGEIARGSDDPWINLRPRHFSDWIKKTLNEGTISNEQVCSAS